MTDSRLPDVASAVLLLGPVLFIAGALPAASGSRQPTSERETDDTGLEAQDPASSGRRPSVAAVRVDTGPIVDGKLDDPVWQQAPAGGPLVQFLPAQGGPMSEPTEFRLLYDRDNLYLGVWCHDSEPDRIIARLMEREGPLWLDDHVIFVLDTFHDRRNGYVFFVNPNGARRDGLISGNVEENHNWDGIWTARATIDHEGWKVEVAIPFETLGYDPDAAVWGFNIERNIQRRAERGRWSGARPQFRTGNVSEAGDLEGIQGLQQGLGLELVPYALGRHRHEDNGGSRSTTTGDFGGDLRYRVTPNMTATLSYNTDFAETEVDARQINFTRFPLFFPEKRSFFLEDSGIFDFGGLTPRQLVPFFSRRIGLSPEGEVVPITVAGKLSGRVGPYNVALIDVLLDDHGDLSAQNAFAGRLSRNVLEQSTVGVISTVGDPGTGAENYLFGSDFRYRTTRFLGSEALEANAFVLGTYSESSGGSSLSPAYGANAAYPGDRFRAEVRFYEIGKDFQPALGFVPRTGTRAYSSLWSWRPRPASIDWVRQFRFTYENELFTDLSGDLETMDHRVTPLFVELSTSDKLFLSTSWHHDAPETDFEIADGTVIEAGEYRWTDATAGAELAPRWPLNGALEATVGEFYDGRHERYSANLDLLYWKHVSLRMNYDYHQVHLPGRDSETHLAGLKMGWHFTPDLLWSHFVQYDSISDTVGYNSRIQWEFRPGSKVFVVLNQNYLKENGSLSLRTTEATVKLAVTLRF